MVLGHEIGHVIEEHALESLRRRRSGQRRNKIIGASAFHPKRSAPRMPSGGRTAAGPPLPPPPARTRDLGPLSASGEAFHKTM